MLGQLNARGMAAKYFLNISASLSLELNDDICEEEITSKRNECRRLLLNVGEDPTIGQEECPMNLNAFTEVVSGGTVVSLVPLILKNKLLTIA